MFAGNRVTLHRAIEENNPEKVTELLKHPSVNINEETVGEITPLCLAAEEGHSKIVEILLKDSNIKVNQVFHKLDVSEKHDYVGEEETPESYKRDVTPIYLAAYHGHEDVVAMLLEHPEVDVNASNGYGCSPLHAACRQGYIEIVKLLLTHSDLNINCLSNIGNTPICIAAQEGYKEIVEVLLGNPNIKVNEVDNHGPPLINPDPDDSDSEACHLDDYIDLIEDTYSVPDYEGVTPLYGAAWNGHTKILELLLEHTEAKMQGIRDGDPIFISPSKVKANLYHLLHVVTNKGHREILKILMQRYKTELYQEHDSLLCSLLHKFASRGWSGAVRELLDYPHLCINSLDAFGTTPLYAAAQCY
eukprot:gb/GECH01010027.1/.p1 GENE.gb/GECH01010027.1/~~gb/GECH01010027.1/.p1  ORF type:complete len:360 (+),score=22.95 gb/GECH01010027.1/:1-1080(+)